ncbi:MAG: hypothetical protein ACJ762_18710 [Solirubrobacteraceae bacterium]
MTTPDNETTTGTMPTEARGNSASVWERLDIRGLRTVPGLRDMVDAFEPLDHPAGYAAAEFLKGEAVGVPADIRPTAATHVLIDNGRIEGFVSTKTAEVKLTETDMTTLGIVDHGKVPSFHICWIAKHADSTVSGVTLFHWALYRASEVRKDLGFAVVTLDPYDKAVTEMWKAEPYLFRESNTKRTGFGVPKKLWIPYVD